MESPDASTQEPQRRKPSNPRPARIPTTEYDVSQIDIAMERCGGNTPHAARVLGWDPNKLYNIIKRDPRLNAKWRGNSDDVPGGKAAEVQRKEPVVPFSAQEIQAAMAMNDQDKLLRRGWGKMGFTPEEQGFLANLQASYADATAGVLRLTGAGVAHTYTRLLFVFEDLLKKITHVDEHPGEYVRTMYTEGGQAYETKGPHEYRCELYDRLISVAGELRKATTDVQRLALIKAQIDKIKVDATKSVRAKQGWKAPGAVVQVNVGDRDSVTVTAEAPQEIEEAEDESVDG